MLCKVFHLRCEYRDEPSEWIEKAVSAWSKENPDCRIATVKQSSCSLALNGGFVITITLWYHKN